MTHKGWHVVKPQHNKECHISNLQYKIWLKPSAEQQFLYGHHVMKSGLGRITENTPQYQGVIVYNMADLPLVISHCLILYILKEVTSLSLV